MLASEEDEAPCSFEAPSTEAGRWSCCTWASTPASSGDSNSGSDFDLFRAICASGAEEDEEEVEVAESMVPQGESEDSVPVKEAAPITIPLSGDWPLCRWSLEQLVGTFMEVVVGYAYRQLYHTVIVICESNTGFSS